MPATANAPIFVIDAIVARPGRANQVADLYLERYAPRARDRGMALCHRWISPPVQLGGSQANTLTFVWSVAGVPGWWKMRHGALADPDVRPFWQELQPLIQARTRTFHAEPADV